MKHLLRSILVAALALGAVPRVHAQTPNLQLTMKDGRVTIVARDVLLRELLDAWARVGQTRIVNADKLAGTRITIKLVDTTERDALDIVLRSAAGYIAASRPNSHPGPSTYDRITILATSSAAPAMTANPQLASPTGSPGLPASRGIAGFAASRGYPALYTGGATPPITTPADTAEAADVAADNGDEPAAGSQDGVQEIPQYQPAVTPPEGVHQNLESAQPRNLDINKLLQGQQGPPVTPPTSSRPGMMPGQIRPPGGGGE